MNNGVGRSSNSSHQDRGVVLIAVLFMMVVLYLLGWSEAQFALTERKRRQADTRDRCVREALEYGLVRLETEVRHALFAAPSIERSQLYRTYFEAARVPYAEVAVRVTGRIEVVDETHVVSTVARNPENGQPMRVVRPALYLLDVDERLLRELVADLVTRLEQPPELGDWLVAQFLELRETTDAHPWDRLHEQISARAEVDGVDATGLRSVVMELDPHPRLRRTNQHPDRRGRDRGRVDAPGVVLTTGPSGRFRLRVFAWLDARPARVVERAVSRTLIERRFLSTQSDWRRASATWSSDLRLGPEMTEDAPVVIGTARAVPGAWDRIQWTRYGGWARGDSGDAWLASGRVLEVDRAGRDSDRADATRRLVALGSGEWLEFSGEQLWFPDAENPISTGDSIAGVGALSSAIVVVGSTGRVQWFDRYGYVLHESAMLDGVTRALFVAPHYDAVVIATSAGWFSAHASGRVEAWSGPPVDSVLALESDRVASGWGLLGTTTLARFEFRPPEIRAKLARMDSLFPPARDLLVIDRRPVVRHDGGPLSAWSLQGGRIVSGDVDLPTPLDRTGAMLAQASPPGVWFDGGSLRWSSVDVLAGKRSDLDGHLILTPRGARVASVFHAGCDGTLSATSVDAQGDLSSFESSGTLAAEPSVLGGSDLSDLFVDGAYSSPRRAETLRYSTSEQAIEVPISCTDGWWSALLKPERSAAESTERDRWRTVTRFEQRSEITLQPTPSWLAAHHPAHPSAATIRSISVQGGSRPLVLRSELRRGPLSSAWVHSRSIDVLGPPWIISVAAGDPLVWLDPWTVDSIETWCPPANVSVPDDSAACEWHCLSLSWSEAAVSIAFDEQFASVARTIPAVFAIAADCADWVLEYGGPIGDKAFQGTVRDLRLGNGGVPEFQSDWLEPSSAASTAHFRWVTNVNYARLRSVHARGPLPAGADVEWSIEAIDREGVWRVPGSGRTVPGGSLPRAQRYVISGRLIPGPDARWPLLEGVVAEFLAPLPDRRYRDVRP